MGNLQEPGLVGWREHSPDRSSTATFATTRASTLATALATATFATTRASTLAAASITSTRASTRASDHDPSSLAAERQFYEFCFLQDPDARHVPTRKKTFKLADRHGARLLRRRHRITHVAVHAPLVTPSKRRVSALILPLPLALTLALILTMPLALALALTLASTSAPSRGALRRRRFPCPSDGSLRGGRRSRGGLPR